MNTFKIFSMLTFFCLLSACSQNINKEESFLVADQGQSSGVQATTIGSKKHQKAIPKFLASSNSFQRFVNDENLNYEQKSALINEFFAQRELYAESQVLDVFAVIGSETPWDADLISQFKHQMEGVISAQPDMLCEVADRLSDEQMGRFITFYLEGMIWVDNFPDEFYALQACHVSKFNVAVESFYARYVAESTRQMTQRYIINDLDGNTNLRAKPISHSSQIVGHIENGQLVIPLWRDGNWVFIKAGNQVGYVHSKNLSETIGGVAANTPSVANSHPTPQKTNDKQMSVKIYFDIIDENMQPYVIRQVSVSSPLKQALETYLKGVTPKENKQGYRSNTLGMTRVEVAIKNHVANIHFFTEEPQIESPTQVIDFTYNVTKIAEQFSSVNSAQICINGMSNYQTAFFASEPLVDCEF